MTALLEIDDVSVNYGAVNALRGISLTVGDGEIVTLLGANGAGKTTSLRTISGLLSPASGVVRFKGERIDQLPAHKVVALGIGHVADAESNDLVRGQVVDPLAPKAHDARHRREQPGNGSQ